MPAAPVVSKAYIAKNKEKARLEQKAKTEKLLAEKREKIQQAAKATMLGANTIKTINQLNRNSINIADIEGINPSRAANDLEMAPLSNEDKAKTYLSVLQASDIGTVNKISAEAKSGLQTISLNHISDLVNQVVHNRIAGVAAGDESSKIEKGLWIRGLYGTISQKDYKGLSSYNAKSSGVTIGGDIEFDNSLLLGAAFSDIRSTFKFGDDKAGDKVKARSKVFSLYGKRDLTERVQLSGVVSLVKSNIKMKTQKTIGNNKKKTASAKYTTNGLTANAKIAYNKQFENGIALTPFIGLNYSKNTDSSFSETGVGVHNLSVSGKKSQYLTGRLGGAVRFKQVFAGNVGITPTLEISVDQLLSSKSDSLAAKLNWNNKTFENKVDVKQSQKTAVNLGGSLNFTHKNIDLMASYGTTMKRKYQSHQGTVKLRINF